MDFLIPVNLYCERWSKYSSVHCLLNSGSLYQDCMHSDNDAFSFRHLITMLKLFALQQVSKAFTSSEHLALALSRINLGMRISVSTFLSERSFGSPNPCGPLEKFVGSTDACSSILCSFQFVTLGGGLESIWKEVLFVRFLYVLLSYIWEIMAMQRKTNVRLPPEVNRILYVRNLPYKITAEEMYDIFGKYGAIRQIRVGNTPETRGTAFVVYEDIFDAKNACDHLSGFNVCNRYLVVLYYQSNKAFKRIDQDKKIDELNRLKKKYGVATDEK